MAIKASEISELIRQRIQNFEAKAEARDVGTVIALTDGICRIHGLERRAVRRDDRVPRQHATASR